jgi:hypothetical protein
LYTSIRAFLNEKLNYSTSETTDWFTRSDYREKYDRDRERPTVERSSVYYVPLGGDCSGCETASTVSDAAEELDVATCLAQKVRAKDCSGLM